MAVSVMIVALLIAIAVTPAAAQTFYWCHYSTSTFYSSTPFTVWSSGTLNATLSTPDSNTYNIVSNGPGPVYQVWNMTGTRTQYNVSAATPSTPAGNIVSRTAITGISGVTPNKLGTSYNILGIGAATGLTYNLSSPVTVPNTTTPVSTITLYMIRPGPNPTWTPAVELGAETPTYVSFFVYSATQFTCAPNAAPYYTRLVALPRYYNDTETIQNYTNAPFGKGIWGPWSTCTQVTLTVIGPISMPSYTVGVSTVNTVYAILNATGTRTFVSGGTGVATVQNIISAVSNDGSDFLLSTNAPVPFDNAGMSFGFAQPPVFADGIQSGAFDAYYVNYWNAYGNNYQDFVLNEAVYDDNYPDNLVTAEFGSTGPYSCSTTTQVIQWLFTMTTTINGSTITVVALVFTGQTLTDPNTSRQYYYVSSMYGNITTVYGNVSTVNNTQFARITQVGLPQTGQPQDNRIYVSSPQIGNGILMALDRPITINGTSLTSVLISAAAASGALSAPFNLNLIAGGGGGGGGSSSGGGGGGGNSSSSGPNGAMSITPSMCVMLIVAAFAFVGLLL